eukprot:GHVL01033091.1.p1 GENE.GHVL01033091.1~~GHVL01033091.1.p1  ORF type:complete len:263 (-),score=26.25 GHVL01033091.1:108-896(-)
MNIQFKHKCLFFKDFIKHNISFVKDVMNENDIIISFEDLCQKVGYKPSRQFEYNALCTALKSRRTDTLPYQYFTLQDFIVNGGNITAKFIRKCLVDLDVQIPSACDFWKRKHNVDLDKRNWLLAVNSTKEERLRLLHWKLLHRIYPTNILLNKMGLRTSNKCEVCNELDTLEHFFFSCQEVMKGWKICKDFVYKKIHVAIILNEENVFLGYFRESLKSDYIYSVNYCILITKMTIGKFRYGKKLDLGVLLETELNIWNKFML